MSENFPAVVVIGGGIVGLSIAWRLGQRGYSVTVFDQGRMGGEASWAGAGMLAPGGEADEASELTSLMLESRRLYPQFIAELGADAIDYQECGGLELAYSEAELTHVEHRAAAQASAGILSRPLSVDEIRRGWPAIRTGGLFGGRFYPDDAIVNGRDLIPALIRACRQVGVKLAEHRRISRVEPSNTVTVIAAGAWSGDIVVKGVPPLPRSEPVKGHLIGYYEPAGTCPTIVRHSSTYLLQRANGLLIAGASVEHVGFDRSISPETTQQLKHQAAAVLPHLTDREPDEVWTGFRPGPEGLQLGRWHSPKVLLAYGHYRNGILLAPVTAEWTASLLASKS